MDHGEGNDNKIKFNVSTDGSGGTVRNIDGVPHTTQIAEGIGTDYKHLATEKYFKMYWNLLHSDKYDPGDLPYWQSIFTALMIIVGILKSNNYGPFVFLGNWGGKHIPPWISTAESPSITQATLNLGQLTSSHTLTLKDSGSNTVQEVKYTVPDDQKSKITTIKNQDNATIKLTLTLNEVTIKQGSTNHTLNATASITTTKTVNKGTHNTVATNLTDIHTLTFNSTNLKQNLGSGPSVTIGPRAETHKTLELNDPSANGGPTNLKLELAPGTTNKMTLDSSGNNTLTLSGGIQGTLQYESGALTATTITEVKYNLNDFHYTLKYNG